MATSTAQRLARAVWELAATQHGLVTRGQLLELGATPAWIRHRIAKGRLHPVMRGVYAVGRPGLTREGEWMAAVLRAGDEARLSHSSAALAYSMLSECPGPIEVSVPPGVDRRVPGIRIHRRSALRPKDGTEQNGIPVTSPALTIVDMAIRLDAWELERMINQADKLDLITPERLRTELDEMPRVPGIPRVRRLLDRWTFTLTDSELERLFIPIALRAGLPMPLTQQRVNGFRVDFFWPDLSLVVETDGLRYHRTPAAQARDRRRDQAHLAAGLTPLRFTHAQVKFEPGEVGRILATVAAQCARPAA